LNETAGAVLNLLLELEYQQSSRQAARFERINRAVGSTMIAATNIPTYPKDGAEATFCNSVAFVEGRLGASRVGVVLSGLSTTPNPLTAHAFNNLLSPFSNIRAISHKLCKRLSSAILEDHRP
jgi:hypothetical protein